jgi:hypothetical protein
LQLNITLSFFRGRDESRPYISDLVLRLLRSLRPFFFSSVAALPRWASVVKNNPERSLPGRTGRCERR